MDSSTDTNVVHLRQAVRPGAGNPKHNETADDTKLCIDVMFLIANNTSLRLDYNEFNTQAMDFLTHKVSRVPSDLQSHVQRIYLYMADFDGTRIYSALLDLFIALGDKGLPLRKRMLQEARHYLKLQHYSVLKDSLDRGVAAEDPMPTAPTSVLTKSYISKCRLIQKIARSKREKPKSDPIIEAHQYLEFGQIEEAKSLLEVAVLNEPWRKDLQDDLLEIYRVTLDGESCNVMYQKLADSFIPDHQAWTRTSEQIQHSVGVA